VLSGDWSLGADRYVRMMLSAMTNGNERFFLYSMHGDNRYGWPIHMFTEPQRLLRPVLLALSGLAYMVEGAAYVKRLSPAHDVSALVFRQARDRPYANGPSTVVALFAHGQAPEDLPRPLPAGVRCYDRFANPVVPPRQATRSPVYLVATGALAETVLAVLSGEDTPATIPPPADERGVEALLTKTAKSLSSGRPPLWALFSPQGSLAVMEASKHTTAVRRGQLRSDPELARRFRLPSDVLVDQHSVQRSGELAIGWARAVAGSDTDRPGRAWHLVFAATPDGFAGGWRHTALTIVPDRTPRKEANTGVMDALRRIERAVAAGNVWALRDHHYRDRFLCGLCKPDGEAFWLGDADGYLQMFQTAMFFGAPRKPTFTPSKVVVGDNVAAVVGRWQLTSLFFGPMPYDVAVTLIRTDGDWRLAGLCLSAGGPTKPRD